MYDVIIVGGGVAGCYLASRLAGLNILLIEKNKKVTLKDSGIVSKDFLDFFDRSLIKDEITKMEAFSPNDESFTLSNSDPFAYIIKRVEFSRHLREIAKRGAEIVYENVLGVTYGKDFVTVHTTGGSHHGKIVVGTDGANSIVRKYARIQRPFLSLGVMVKTGGNMGGDISVFFNKHFSPDFFAWIIPQNNEYGTISSIRPREYLRHFEKKQFLPGGQMIAYLIPTGYVKSYSERTLLIGDACGQNKPLTGGGIMFSLRAVLHAQGTIEKALERGRFDEKMLKQYEADWKRDFAREIDKQFLVRMLYRNLTNSDIDRIFREIGPEMQKLSGFDYDKFSGAWVKLPKFKMMKIALRTAMNML
ncbi:MAG: NAD(P)/FAD-dependent oxidoreductase [Candidatus Aenigmarchaeota archaeon]|nr:NAD(P)/FAD-dependent oxidoreductase [Candidatus Aenigmarchaeota archaeon]